MKSEKDKMLAGELYDPLDPELEAGRLKARELCRRLNASREEEKAERRELLDELFGAATDVWIGGGAIICPGVNIGARSIIGAGSVVTKDIPDDVFAAGNPCRVIRRLRD